MAGDGAVPPEDGQAPGFGDGVAPPPPPSVRAQLLATEHWGLLAARSSTQSEVLTRITMFLTLVSAGLVSLALIGQATDFSEGFGIFAIVVLAFAVLVGVLTQIRVFNAAMDDLMYVVAMNRLRAAYAELDPGIERYFMASTHDDAAGVTQTYYFLGSRRTQVAGSSMVFMVAVNSALLALLVAAIAMALGATTPVVVGIGALCGIVFLLASLWWGSRPFFAFVRDGVPMFPTPAG
ncbi:hypothetical protein [Planctomonas deserti]|uniref:hypothetical protein n=1 Tax=Planctomonas deserti TaxID=2144185 RepID=UPI003F66727A